MVCFLPISSSSGDKLAMKNFQIKIQKQKLGMVRVETCRDVTGLFICLFCLNPNLTPNQWSEIQKFVIFAISMCLLKLYKH